MSTNISTGMMKMEYDKNFIPLT